MRITIFRQLPIYLFMSMLFWGCAGPGAITTTSEPEPQISAKQEANTYAGKILGISQKASTITIATGKGAAQKNRLVKFDENTRGVKHAKKNHAAIISYEMRDNEAYALVIKPKLAKLPPGVTEIKTAELKDLIDKKTDLTLIDSRPAKRYNQAHIPTALSLPVSDMNAETTKLPVQDNNSLIVFYCGGPTCGMSTKAAAIAKKMGYTNIRVMLDGEPGWVQAGHPTYASHDFIAKGNIVLVDLRDEESSKNGRIPRSVTIALYNLRDRLEDISMKAPVVFYSDLEQDSLDALQMLREEQYQKVSLVYGGLEGWRQAGGALEQGPIITDIEWRRKLGKGEVPGADFEKTLTGKDKGTLLLDVRTHDEVAGGKLTNALHIPLDELTKRKAELPKDKKIYIYCSTGARAEMAYLDLLESGFTVKFLVADVECEEGECDIDY